MSWYPHKIRCDADVVSGGEIDVLSGGALKFAGVAVTEHLGIDGVTASAAEVNKLTGSGAVVPSGTAASHIVDAKVDYADDGGVNDLDTDAKRVAAMNAANAKINSILAALEAFGITASS